MDLGEHHGIDLPLAFLLQVRGVILDTTAMGRRHRDHATTGSTLKSMSQSALHDYFFGPDGNQKLKIAKFLEFQSRLQEEITQLEVSDLPHEIDPFN